MANNSKTKTTPEPQRTYIIGSTQLMEVMRYLMSRPYAEVVKIMNMLSTLNQLDPKIGADFVKRTPLETNDKK